MVNKVDFDLKKGYFNHLVEIVCNKQHHRMDYIPLLDLLNSIPFVVMVDMDENRADYGAFLRKRWLQNEDLYEYLYEFDDDKVSVLEVLIGIAQRLEDQVGDVMEGDHTSDRFWEILHNLDIEKYDSKNYKPLNIKEKVRNWMLRKYKNDGSGSIFPIKNVVKNYNSLQIWDQMSIYVMEKY